MEFKVSSPFVVYGECSSFLVEGHDRVDCMNLVNREKGIIGGLLYEAFWIKVNPPKPMKKTVAGGKK